jgi:hypothetical protein
VLLQPEPCSTIDFVDFSDAPCATFHFLYTSRSKLANTLTNWRPLDSYRSQRLPTVANGGTGELQSLDVVPRTPSPIPLEEKPEDELTTEELRKLTRRLRVSKSCTE